MTEKYLLQQYDNGTFGYKGIDDCPDKNQLKEKGFGEGREIIAEQREDETREDFIIRTGISFIRNQYGSIEEYDRKVNNEEWEDRREVARHGYGLDKLVNDKVGFVRETVAEQGYGLDILINDEHYMVRQEVARQGYSLDKLINDEDYRVRLIVVGKGYGLDKLINDENEYVREEVAQQRYGLDKLINDKHWWVRGGVAEQGYGLNILINDKDENVREKVASQGYGLNKLVYDKSSWVRAEVARQGYGLDILVYDENKYVREEVAKQGYGLNRLIKDKEELVRREVLRQGYGLDKLINDKEWYVRIMTQDYLKENGLTLEEWIEQNPEKCALKESKELIQQNILYKRIDESEKLKIEESNKFDGFSILTVDTNIPLITFEKVDNKYICSNNLESDNFEFNYKRMIKTKTELNKYIDYIIGELENSKEFYKYIEDIKLLKQ